MKYLDTLAVALLLIGAMFYLYRVFKPKGKKSSGGCGCGTVDCKVKQSTKLPAHLTQKTEN